eukprot:4486407-Pleurochrysis_carterae.AAC.1
MAVHLLRQHGCLALGRASEEFEAERRKVQALHDAAAEDDAKKKLLDNMLRGHAETHLDATRRNLPGGAS